MKNIKFLSYFIVGMLISLVACKKETPILNEKGLTKAIQELVPEEVLEEMEALGMPIHGGDQPPNIENSFVASPLILLGSNIEDDPEPGYLFEDYYVTFSEQKDDELSVMVDYTNGLEVGEGIGSFIVGRNNRFSVFIELSVEAEEDKATAVAVISGELSPEGIKDFHYAIFIVDILSNTNGYFIEEGKGRVSYDEDGVSEKL